MFMWHCCMLGAQTLWTQNEKQTRLSSVNCWGQHNCTFIFWQCPCLWRSDKALVTVDEMSLYDHEKHRSWVLWPFRFCNSIIWLFWVIFNALSRAFSLSHTHVSTHTDTHLKCCIKMYFQDQDTNCTCKIKIELKKLYIKKEKREKKENKFQLKSRD